jgi:hypothetical protein
MAVKQKSSRSVKWILGITLLSLGFLFLFSNLDALASSLGRAAGQPQEDASSTVLDLGLAGMHAIQAYAFDHAHFLSSLRGILVSFWPLVLVLIGAVLLRDVFMHWLAIFTSSAGSLQIGERS